MWSCLLWLQRIIPLLCNIWRFLLLLSHCSPILTQCMPKFLLKFYPTDDTKSKWRSYECGKTLNLKSSNQQILANTYLHNLRITRALPPAEQAQSCVCGACICAKGHCGNAVCLTLTWQEWNYPAFRVFLASFHREFIQQLHLKNSTSSETC